MATTTDIDTAPRPGGIAALPEKAALSSGILLSEIAELAATIALYTFLPVLFLRAFYIVDPDIWWHLRTGQWILSHHAVPRTDPFSAYGMGKPWVAYSWLFETLMALVFDRFGLVGIALYEIAARVSLAVSLFHLARGLLSGFWRPAALAAAGLLVMTRIIGPRPGMLTIVFIILEFEMLLSSRKTGHTKTLWLLPPMFILWANLHIQFVYGLAVLAGFACEPLLDAVFRYSPKDKNFIPLKQTWVILIASTLATLLNPYGTGIYSTVFGLMRQSKVYDMIDELRAMSFREPQHFAALLMVLGAAMAVGWRRDLRPLWLLFLAGASFLAFRSVREIWFLAVISVVVIADGWASATPRENHSLTGTRQRALIYAWVLAILLVSCRHYGLSDALLEVQVAGTFPEAAVQFISQHTLPGPLLNDLSWGGYLIWRLPQLPVAIDNRTNIHGDARIQEFSDLWKGKPGWASDLELARANLVLTPRDAAIASLLRGDPRFRVAYEDVQAVVFQRK